MVTRTLEATYKLARRIIIGVVGFTVLLLGMVMLVTPGPALLIIPLGLGILSLEFAWARIWLKRIRRKIAEQGERWRGGRVTDRPRPRP